MTEQPERRENDARIRDLEESMRVRKAGHDQAHGETITSLNSLHKRQGEVIDENRIGTRVILDEISKVVATVGKDLTASFGLSDGVTRWAG